MSKLRYKEGGVWKSIAPSQKEFDDNKTEVTALLADNTQKLSDTAKMKKLRLEVFCNEDLTETDVLKVELGASARGRAVQIYNRSGITNGSLTGKINAYESIVLHHYNDNNPVIIDNVGRDNIIMTLRQASNPTMAGHSEVGRGSYLNFDRSGSDLPVPLAVEHLGRVSAEDWWDVGMLAAEHTWGLTLVGKRNSVNKVQTTLPVLIYSKGLDVNNKGADALRIHSTDYGGIGLKLTNTINSYGALINVDNISKQAGSNAIYVKHTGDVPAISVYNNGKPVSMMQFNRKDALFADIIDVRNESYTKICALKGDGKGLQLTDITTGILKTIQINNGVLEVV